MGEEVTAFEGLFLGYFGGKNQDSAFGGFVQDLGWSRVPISLHSWVHPLPSTPSASG